MKVTLTGATGPIGARLVAILRRRDDDVTVLTRNPAKARDALEGVEAVGWDPMSGPAPAEALAGRDGVVHLAGETVAQRWNDETRARIHASRETGTRNLVAGLRAARATTGAPASWSPRRRWATTASTATRSSTSRSAPATTSWPACAWPGSARRRPPPNWACASRASAPASSSAPTAARSRRCCPSSSSASAAPWRAAASGCRGSTSTTSSGCTSPRWTATAWTGAVNGSAPEPVTNREFSRRLGKALHRPAFAPVPGFAVRLLYGDMAEIVTEGQRAVPKRPLELGYAFRHADLDEALGDAVG